MSRPIQLNRPTPATELDVEEQPQSAFDQLLARQQAFVRNYLLMDGNATQAYLLAYGCTYNSAAVHGHRLINDSKVAAAIQEQRQVLRARTGASEAKILQERARLAFSDMRDFTDATGRLKPPDELSRDDSAAIQEWSETVKYGGPDAGDAGPQVSRKLKLYDKERSLAFLERLYGLGQPERENRQVSIEIHFGSAAPPGEPSRPELPGGMAIDLDVDDS